MAVQSDGSGRDEIKTQFMTREGTYKQMTLSEYSRPNRLGYTTHANTPVKVSFVTLPPHSNNSTTDDPNNNHVRICFNVGRELYTYVYKGVKKAADLTKPLDKHTYKGLYPTCHDFNKVTVCSDSVSLLVGFSAGQVQLVDPIRKELNKLYNEERLIDKTKVTCLRWLPGSPTHFLVSHNSGQMYVYNEDLPCGNTPPHYQLFKQGDGFAIYTCKTKSTRNPLYRWIIGDGALNEFAFSPCSKYLAIVSQDGFLRVFNYNTMDIIGIVRSYFGGLLCVCWSPDGKYVVIGGEDDLVTVWSFHDRRVVARGQGHKSWVGVVSFDEYTTCYGNSGLDGLDFSGGSDDEQSEKNQNSVTSNQNTLKDGLVQSRTGSRNSLNVTSYRFGSVGQDTQLCLWDLTEDVLKQPLGRTRTSVVLGASSQVAASSKSHNVVGSQTNCISTTLVTKDMSGSSCAIDSNDTNVSSSLSHKFATLSLVSSDKKEKHCEQKEHRRNFSLASSRSTTDKNNTIKGVHHHNHHNQNSKLIDDPVMLIGTLTCPRVDQIPILEPLVCKKIAHERLTALVFREDCVVTACQEGYVCTWARPGKLTSSLQQGSNNNSTCGSGAGRGTVV